MPATGGDPSPARTPRTATDVRRRRDRIRITDQYGATWTYPGERANDVIIPTAVARPPAHPTPHERHPMISITHTGPPARWPSPRYAGRAPREPLTRPENHLAWLRAKRIF